MSAVVVPLTIAPSAIWRTSLLFGGRVVPPRAAATTAIVGGGCVIALIAYLVVNRASGRFHPRPLITTGFATDLDLPDPGVLAVFLL